MFPLSKVDFQQQKALPAYVPPTELQIQLKIDELFKAYRYYKHTHTKQSVMEIIHIAQCLQGWGYDLIIDSSHRLVGCQRRPNVH